MKSDKTTVIGTIIAVVILILIIVLSNLGIDSLAASENVLGKIFMPIQNGFTFVKNKITGNEMLISDMDRLKQQNTDLIAENDKLKELLREYEVIKNENNSLKEFMNLKNKYTDYTTMPCKVIEQSFSNYDKIIILDSGSKDGLKENMAVISEEGLVGHIISVTEDTAKVSTILDTASTVSCNISTSEQTILVKGEIGEDRIVRGTYIPTEASILEGDVVVTSSLGGIYPRGILVGTIKEAINTQNEVDRYLKITTAVDFQTLTSVLVITN